MIKKFIALAAVAAMLFACGEKPEPTPNPNPNPGTGTEEPEPEFESAIAIDGDFADWDAVEAVVATLPETGTPKYSQLKTLKAYADEYFICLYIEYDPSNLVRTLDLFINDDNDPVTGHKNLSGGWEECVGLMLQGSFYNFNADYTEQMSGKSWDPSIYMFGGEDGGEAWEWVNLGVGGAANSSIATMINDTTAAVEIQIIREMIPMPLADTIGLGLIVETAGWSSVGALPAIAEEDKIENGATNHLLTLTLPAAEL